MGLMGHFDDAHLLKVDVDGIVQDALTVCLVHHDQRVHLQQQPQPNVIFTHLLLQKGLKDTGKCTQKKIVPFLWRRLPAAADAERWGSPGATFQFWS